MIPVIHGIPTCSTVRKARAWLNERGIEHRFHDLRREGIPDRLIERLVSAAGWERALNRSGTSFRALPDDVRHGLNEERAIVIMHDHPTTIRRPVLVGPFGVEIGFDPARYEALFPAA